MGYTHYWNANDIDPASFTKVAKAAAAVAEGHKLIGTLGRTPPVFTESLICFNGKGDLGHETFRISPGDEGFDFCKTGEMPYDIVVTATLCLLHYYAGVHVTSDGEPDQWSDGLALARKVAPDCPLPPGIQFY